MTTFATKSDFVFEPRAAVSLATAEVAHTTPGAFRKTLGGLALINGTKGELAYKFSRPSGAASVVVTLTLKTGAAILATESITLPANADTTGKITADLGGISGGSPMFCEVEVTTLEAGESCDFDAVLTAETPVVIGGC